MKVSRPEAPASPPSSTAATGDTTTGHPALLAVRRWGAKVIPLHPGGKQPRIMDWSNRGTTDEATIRGWLVQCPTMNYGIVCGPTGWLILDEDQAGELARLCADQDQELPPTLRLKTGRGYHLVFRQPSKPIGNVDALKQAGYQIDVRGDGGYIVGPGSLHASGARYEVADDLPVAELPRWLEKLLRAKAGGAPGRVQVPAAPRLGGGTAKGRAAFAREVADLRDAQPGGRNTQLHSAAYNLGQLVRSGDISESEVRQELESAAIHSGLKPPEIAATIDSGLRAGMNNPRANREWVPFDTAGYLANPLPDPEHIGLGGMLYRGALHWFAGEPETGKSVLLLAHAVQIAAAGERVVWVDEEAGPRDVLGKLAALGGGADQFDYFEPGGRDLAGLPDYLQQDPPALVVLDSASAALAIAGADEDRAPDVTRFVLSVLLPLAHELGCAVAVIDHKTKSGAESRYARGSGAKLAKTDVALNVELVTPFAKGRSGELRVVVTKDRLGDFGRDHQWVVAVDASEGLAVRARALSATERAMLERQDLMADAILAFVGKRPGATSTDIQAVLKGRKQTKLRAIAELGAQRRLVRLADGYALPEPTLGGI